MLKNIIQSCQRYLNADGMPIRFLRAVAAMYLAALITPSLAAVAEFNNTGGTSASNGLHFYIEGSTHMQVRRLNNTGQVYSPGATPPSANLDNGVFLLANGKVYGPSHNVGGGFTPGGGMYNTYSITAPVPANPSTSGVQQIATNSLGITAGPQVTINWKYTTPLDFLTADVTITIPPTFNVSVAKPVRYYHVFDTYLGGSDSGCGVKFTDSNGKTVVGTYPPPSGTSCPSSTAIPNGVTIVESFRERSGRAFSNYCAAGWSTFYTNGGPNCSISQTAPLSNTIVTSYQDTGIGVEFDFTAPGTYTFSYDFVIGSTVVPAYDHLEIVHDTTATLCPENVTILACTSSTVPCPDGASVNTGTLTGNLKVTPAAPAVSVTPATFSIGPTVYNPTVVLQGSGAGTYTLSISGISGTVPLNGVKCSDGMVATDCKIKIANTPCVADFECMETGQPYNTPVTTTSRNPLYTKMVGTAFTFDVLALQSDGAIATGYTGAVTVELFDATAKPAPFCAFTGTAVASQTLTYLAGDGGRKTLAVPVNLSAAYPNLRCQVKQSVPTAVSGCSSDAFAVRPSAITLTATTLSNLAMATGPSANAMPVIQAGTGFKLSGATTPAASYAGSLTLDTIDTSKLTAQTTTQDTAQASGGAVGALSPAVLTANAGFINATYNEVGYLYLAPGAYRDDLFTAVDSATGDCISNTNLNANLSDTLSGGKYGCSIGNKTSSTFGRFIPDHFEISSASLTPACASFTYFGHDGFSTGFTLSAKNSANNVTQNYTGTFAKLNLGTYTNYGFSAAPLDAGSILASSATVPSGNWSGGVASVTAKHQISRPTALAAPGLVTVSAAPTDGEVPAATPVALGSTQMRYGRMKMQNAHGSELLDLPISLIAQYWNGSMWVKNIDDSCTPVVAPTSGAGLTFVAEVAANVKGNHLSAAETTATVSATGKLSAGDGKFKLSKPGAGNNGYVDIAFPVPDWLKFPWKGGGLDINPPGRATFGIYKNSNEFIYLRELH